MSDDLFETAGACLACADPGRKSLLARALHEDWRGGRLRRPADTASPTGCAAGRPERPPLVSPGRLEKRGPGSVRGQAALVHAVAHIEFNAINLACDAVYRFRDLPDTYYDDWTRVAAEEAHHFDLLQARLRELGFAYGDFPAHDGLWELACKTAHDPLLRMALVPRVMEARGLDVTPGMQQRFERSGDRRTAQILAVILRDEVGHVEAGSRWFRHLCGQRGLDPERTFFDLLRKHLPAAVRGPLHLEARRAAGFSESELGRLQGLAGSS